MRAHGHGDLRVTEQRPLWGYSDRCEPPDVGGPLSPFARTVYALLPAPGLHPSIFFETAFVFTCVCSQSITCMDWFSPSTVRTKH